MTETVQPAIVAYDGSEEARAAVRAAARLLAGRPLLVVSVWEPGLALAMASVRDPAGIGFVAPSGAEMAAIDRAQRDHASDAAEAGAQLARELGATATPLPVPDEVDVAETLAALADEHDACAIVVGSRGLGGLKSRLMGSTSRELLQQTERPVLVVRAPG